MFDDQIYKRLLTVKMPTGFSPVILTHFSGVESMSAIFTYTLRIRSKACSVDIKQLLFKAITVIITPLTNQESTRFFNGYINQIISGEQLICGYREYSITMYRGYGF